MTDDEQQPIHPQAPACSDDAWKLCLQMLDWAARHSYVMRGSVQSCMDPAMFLYSDTIERKPTVPVQNNEGTKQNGG